MAEQTKSLVELFRLITPSIFIPVLKELARLWSGVRTSSKLSLIAEVGLRLRLMDETGKEIHRKSVKFSGKIQ